MQDRRPRAGPVLACVAAVASALGAGAASAQGLAFSGAWTGIVATEMSGFGENRVRTGGKIDLFGTLGLAAGLSLEGHAELGYGRNITDADPFFLLPPNTAQFFPENNETASDLSLALTGTFGDTTLTLGKINLIDLTTRTPLVGGGGREGFQHLQLAAPLTNFTPPSVFGALLLAPTRFGFVSLGVWDAESAVQRAWPDGIEEVNLLAGLSVPIPLFGLPGWHHIQAATTTQDTVDLATLPYLALPPVLRPQIEERETGWMLKYAVQQYLWRDPANPERGWGLFAQANVWDGNPTLTDWAFTIGATGTGALASRPQDRFGIGWFVISPSEAIVDSLEAIGSPLLPRDERGAEAFYTWGVGDRLRLTTTGQVIEPGIVGAETAVILSLRAVAEF